MLAGFNASSNPLEIRVIKDVGKCDTSSAEATSATELNDTHSCNELGAHLLVITGRSLSGPGLVRSYEREDPPV